MKKIIIFFVLFGGVWGGVSAWEFRNITAVDFQTYLDGRIGIKAEEVAIFGITPGFNLLAKARVNTQASYFSFGGTVGTVFNVGKRMYSEVSYGIDYHTVNGLIHTALIDWYIETNRFLQLTGFKIQISPTQVTLFPSVAARYVFSDTFNLWGKYTFIYDTVTGIDHSGWVEAGFPLWERTSFSIGATGATYHTDTVPSVVRPEFSGIAGVAYRFTDQVLLKYKLEFTWRAEYQVLTNSLLLDLWYR
jgi:hypothetical protein